MPGMSQVLSCAFARSRGPRSFACARLALSGIRTRACPLDAAFAQALPRHCPGTALAVPGRPG